MSENVRSGRKLSSKQLRALEILLDGGTQNDTAQEIGVSTRTLRRWLNEDPEFRAELNELSRTTIAAASLRLIGVLESSINSLSSICSNESIPASIRVKAARATLSYALKYLETINFEQRLTDLESRR